MPIPAPFLRLLAVAVAALFALAPALADPSREEVVSRLAQPDARGADLSRAQAPGLTISDRDLSGTIWKGADLRGLKIRGVNLSKAVLAGADLRGAVIEQCSLADADLTDADLSGARLRLVELAGANLTDCRLFGSSLNMVLLTPNGGTHGEALRQALAQFTGQTLTRAWVDGLSGDAFGFVYNSDDPGFWPGTPFRVNPIIAAAEALGLKAELRVGYPAQQQLTGGRDLAPGVHLAPVGAAQVEMWMLRDMPLWAIVSGREERDRHTYFTIGIPPLASESVRREAFEERWQGPWPTLEPAGTRRVKEQRPLITITAPGPALPAEAQVRAAARQAAAMLTEKRTYGPLVPGYAGLLRLAGDLRAAASDGDTERARRLALWEQFPRRCFIGSRTQACRFLEEAAAVAGGGHAEALREVIGLYREELASLADGQWPELGPQAEREGVAGRPNYTKAAETISMIAAGELRAAQLLAEAGQ